MERGVIISPYFTFDGRSLHFPRRVGIEPDDLRHYLLYWDKIEYPNNNFIRVKTTPDEQFLIEAGVLQRTDIRLQNYSGDFSIAYLFCQALAARKLNESEPGSWTVAQSGPQLVLPSELSTQVGALEIELYNSLPSPGPDVSFDDILLFKDEHRDELIAFRSYIDELYLYISESGDIPRSKNRAIQKLESAIMDLDQVANQKWSSKLVSGFKVEFNIPSILENAFKGAGVAALTGLPLSLGAALGAAGSMIKIEFGTAPKANGVPQSLRDFAYLCHIKRELRS